MTTTIEADRLSKPDTQSALPPVRLLQGAHQESPNVLTSQLPVWASVPNLMLDFPPPYWTNKLRRLDPTQHSGRMYLVTVSHQGHVQTESVVRHTSDEQMEKHRQHREYLQRVSTNNAPPLITPATAKKSWDLWLALRKAVGTSMPIPSAGTGPDGVMFYSWDKGDHHLEAEIYPERNTEFFYRNRHTGDLWGDDYAGGTFPAELMSKLRLFLGTS